MASAAPEIPAAAAAPSPVAPVPAAAPAPSKASHTKKPDYMLAKLASRPDALAAYQAEVAKAQSQLARLKAKRAAGKASQRPPPTRRGRAIDLSPVFSPSTDVAAFEAENPSDWTADDEDLFTRAACSATRTSVTGTSNSRQNAVSGTFTLRNSSVEWGLCDSNPWTKIYTRSGNELGSNQWGGPRLKYSHGNYNGHCGLAVTRVDMVPLVHNASGDIETYRVDMYKTMLDRTEGNVDDSDISFDDDLFVQETLAVQFLITERVVGNKYVQTDMRVRQTEEELKLQAFLDDNGGANGTLRVVFNDNNPCGGTPQGSVADVQRRGIIYEQTDDGIYSSDFDNVECNGLYFMDLSGVNGTNGIVYHARVPLSFYVTSVPPDTFGAPIPLWVMLLVFLALALGVMSYSRKQ